MADLPTASAHSPALDGWCRSSGTVRGTPEWSFCVPACQMPELARLVDLRCKGPTTITHGVASCARVRRRCRDLLAVDGVLSADVAASIASRATELPAGPAMVVGHFRNAVPAACGNMIDLVGRWLPFLGGEGEVPSPRPDIRAGSVPDL